MPCQNPINSLKQCTIAGWEATTHDKPLDNISGDGIHLPFGCISDRTTSGIHSIFWNPNGIAISADPKLRQICVEQDRPFEGILICHLFC